MMKCKTRTIKCTVYARVARACTAIDHTLERAPPGTAIKAPKGCIVVHFDSGLGAVGNVHDHVNSGVRTSGVAHRFRATGAGGAKDTPVDFPRDTRHCGTGLHAEQCGGDSASPWGAAQSQNHCPRLTSTRSTGTHAPAWRAPVRHTGSHRHHRHRLRAPNTAR